jgi:phage terminase large subunit-like protein
MDRQKYIEKMLASSYVADKSKERLRRMTDKDWDIRMLAEHDLESFIRLVAPHNVMGMVHQEVCSWWHREDAKAHQLVLLPRDHGKSRYVAFRVVHRIVKQPDIRFLYISSTSNLAEKQLKFMRDILTHPIFFKYWPEYVHPEEGKREKWTTSEISIDHPKRKEEGVRDPTIFTGGLTTGITGMHCDIAVLDDIVVKENAYTEEGREKVRSQYSLLSSIQGADSEEWVVGTRYHPNDLYGDMIQIEEELYDEAGYVIGHEPIYEVFEKVVEDNGDGTGTFLWPRQQRYDGKWFGFDRRILAVKRAKYIDKTQFYAQYYNNPNTGDGAGIDRSCFQYYDPSFLRQERGYWYYASKRLNVIASMDLATTVNKTSDYSAIVILGQDSDRFYYVLDVHRFKVRTVSDYFHELLHLYNKWNFKKMVAEVVSHQAGLIQTLKEDHLRKNGISLSIIEEKPTKHDGTKNERMSANLDPAYTNMAVWHKRDGGCQILEDELVMQFPPHDDCKDALSNAIKHMTPPQQRSQNSDGSFGNVVKFHSRFGGVTRAS